MKEFKTIYNYKQMDGVRNNSPSLTQQQFKDECDINKIMDRYLRTGVLSDPLQNRGTPKYGDYADIGDYMDHMNKVVEAIEMFEALPASIRKRFNNNPGELIDFVMDENNRTEAEFLGLIEKKEENKVSGTSIEAEVSVTSGNDVSNT